MRQKKFKKVASCHSNMVFTKEVIAVCNNKSFGSRVIIKTITKTTLNYEN